MEEVEQQTNIYWRNGNAYGRLWINGKEHRRSLRTRDAARAQEELANWRESFTAGNDGAVTFKEAMIAWNDIVYNASDKDGLKPGTRDRYLDSLRVIATMFADYRLEDIDKKAIGQWVRARKKGEVVYNERQLRPATNATIRRDLTALSSMFRAAIASGLYDENPANAWDRGVIPERRDPFYVPTMAEIELVANEASGNFARLIRFAAYTGCRMTEAVELMWPAVRRDRGDVKFVHTKTKRPRVVSLKSPGGDATAALAGVPRHIGVQRVFWHTLGEPYVNVSGNFRDLVARVARAEAEAGRQLPRFSFHKLRHAFAIRWLENGGDIYALSKHLGHTSVKTTEIYLDYINKGYGSTGDEDEAEIAAEAHRIAS